MVFFQIEKERWLVDSKVPNIQNSSEICENIIKYIFEIIYNITKYDNNTKFKVKFLLFLWYLQEWDNFKSYWKIHWNKIWELTIYALF